MRNEVNYLNPNPQPLTPRSPPPILNSQFPTPTPNSQLLAPNPQPPSLVVIAQH
jgi:hypothetical protein